MVNAVFALWDVLIDAASLILHLQTSYPDDVAISPPSYVGSLDLATELARGTTVILPRTSTAMNNVVFEMVESLHHIALLVRALQGLTQEMSPVQMSGPLYPAAILVIVRLRTVS